MATVRPFRAVRPAQKYADKVVSLPYDVMNRQEAVKNGRGKPIQLPPYLPLGN